MPLKKAGWKKDASSDLKSTAKSKSARFLSHSQTDEDSEDGDGEDEWLDFRRQQLEEAAKEARATLAKEAAKASASC